MHKKELLPIIIYWERLEKNLELTAKQQLIYDNGINFGGTLS